MFGISIYRIDNKYLFMNRSDLLDNFKSSVWEKLDSKEKMKLLQATGDLYSREIGLNIPPSFEEEKDKRLYGGYNSYGNAVSINLSKNLNPYEALDSVAHEINHAYQHQCTALGYCSTKQYSISELAVLKAEDGEYISSGEGYDLQSLENDSNSAGASFVLSEQERYWDDPAYLVYMDNCSRRMSLRSSDYINFTAKTQRSEINQVNEAYRKGVISTQERDNAISCISTQTNSIKQEMISVNSELYNGYKRTLKEYYQNQANELSKSDENLDISACVEKYADLVDSKMTEASEYAEILNAKSTKMSSDEAEYRGAILQVEAQALAGRLGDISRYIDNQKEEIADSMARYAVDNGIEADEVAGLSIFSEDIIEYNKLSEYEKICEEKINNIEYCEKYLGRYTKLDVNSQDQRPDIEFFTGVNSQINDEKAINIVDRDALATAYGNAAEVHSVYECIVESGGKAFSEKEAFSEKASVSLAELQQMQISTQNVRDQKMQELSSYIMTNNMSIVDSHRDEYVVQLSSEIVQLDQELSNIRYHRTELETDIELLYREEHHEDTRQEVSSEQTNDLSNNAQENITNYESEQEQQVLNQEQEQEEQVFEQEQELEEQIPDQEQEEQVFEQEQELEEQIPDQEQKEQVFEQEQELEEQIPDQEQEEQVFEQEQELEEQVPDQEQEEQVFEQEQELEEQIPQYETREEDYLQPESGNIENDAELVNEEEVYLQLEPDIEIDSQELVDEQQQEEYLPLEPETEIDSPKEHEVIENEEEISEGPSNEPETENIFCSE